MSYSEQLQSTKSHYPFLRWQANFPDLEQYTEENCAAAQAIIDTLIEQLILLGEAAPESEKVEIFQIAVEALNELNEETDGALIETGEREELCGLFNEVTLAAGLIPENYGEGEGIASEWRDW